MEPRFTLSFQRDDPPDSRYPEGYWYAVTSDSGFDGDGHSPESAMADLINALTEAVLALSADA